MQAIRLVGVHLGWAIFNVLMLTVVVQHLEARIRTMEVVRVDVEFSIPESEYDFADPSSAEIQLCIAATPPSPLSITVQIDGDASFFDFPSELRIPAGESQVFLKAKLRKLPTPGSREEKIFELVSINGPGVLGRNTKHVVTIYNSSLMPAELAVVVPPSPIELAEPLGSANAFESSFSIELRTEPARRAIVELSMDQATDTAKLGEDFAIDGVRQDGDRYFVDIPDDGIATVRVSAIHNAGVIASPPKRFRFRLEPAISDPGLTVRTPAIEGQITDSDRAKLRVTADKDLRLYESNGSRVVHLKIEAINPLPASVAIETREDRSPGLSVSDYSLNWSPSSELRTGKSIELEVAAVDDPQSEQSETLTIHFPDTAQYEIDGDREFTIEIADDDRKLLAGIDTHELFEGGQASLELAFDPPDSKATEVKLRLAQGDPARIKLLGADGKPVLTALDSDGRTKYKLTAPGKYVVNAPENANLQKQEHLLLEFVRAPIAEFQTPGSLELTINDNDALGDVLVVILATKYVLDAAQTGKEISTTFLNRLQGISTLPKKLSLVGGGVYLVGKSASSPPSYLLWKGDKSQLTKFLNPSTLVTDDQMPYCLEDCLHAVAGFTKHFQEVRPGSENVRLVVVWPSDEPPRFGALGDSCRENQVPTSIWIPPGQAHFIWLGTDDQMFAEFFQKDSEALAGFYKLFPRQEATLGEIRESSDESLAKKMGLMLSQTAIPQ